MMTNKIAVSGLITGSILYELDLPDGVVFEDIVKCWVKWDQCSIELKDGRIIDGLQLHFLDENTDTKQPDNIEIMPFDQEDDVPVWDEARSV